MFDIEFSKMLIVGAIALVLVGPKDLPRALRALGQIMGQMRRLSQEARGQFDQFMREADLDQTAKEVADLARARHLELALNPKTVMRSARPAAAAAAEPAEMVYASEEMRNYLAPLAADAPASPPPPPAAQA